VWKSKRKSTCSRGKDGTFAPNGWHLGADAREKSGREIRQQTPGSLKILDLLAKGEVSKGGLNNYLVRNLGGKEKD